MDPHSYEVDSEPFPMRRDSNSQKRKIPNLKGLRDMIKRNTHHHGHASPHKGGNKSDRMTMQRNESECSFTLTDDEDRENNDLNGGSRRSGGK